MRLVIEIQLTDAIRLRGGGRDRATCLMIHRDELAEAALAGRPAWLCQRRGCVRRPGGGGRSFRLRRARCLPERAKGAS